MKYTHKERYAQKRTIPTFKKNTMNLTQNGEVMKMKPIDFSLSEKAVVMNWFKLVKNEG